MTIKLVRTCYACPEQWEAYRGKERVGYLRYRWGHFTVECPDVAEELVYEAIVDPRGYGGYFTIEERQHYLREAVKAIEDWLKIPVTGEYDLEPIDETL
jgi:hypothetical protein